MVVVRRKAASLNTQVGRVSLTVRACCASVLLLMMLILTGTEWELIVMAVSLCLDIHVKLQDLVVSHFFVKN